MMFIVCVTACPTGIAHTFMAAESLQNEARDMGIDIKVETQGSLGADNEIDDDDIARADGVIIASEVAIEGAERAILAGERSAEQTEVRNRFLRRHELTESTVVVTTQLAGL